MNIKCPNCGAEYEVERKNFGRFTTCESCGKGFVIGAKTGTKPNDSSNAANHVEHRSPSGIAIWICVVVLVLNLAALVTLCCLMHSNFGKIGTEVAKVRNSIDTMNEDLGGRAATLEKRTVEIDRELKALAAGIDEELNQLDKSRHHDAEQIFDRMGRMKLY